MDVYAQYKSIWTIPALDLTNNKSKIPEHLINKTHLEEQKCVIMFPGRAVIRKRKREKKKHSGKKNILQRKKKPTEKRNISTYLKAEAAVWNVIQNN